MKKQHFTNIARLIVLALLVTPVMAWATNCQQADRLFNRSLRVGSAQSDLLNQAIDLCPNHVRALNNLANIMEKEGNLSSAQWFYDRAIKADPNFALAYAGLGDVLMKRKDYQGAVEAFQKFLTVQEKNGDSAYVQHYTKRLEEARNNFVIPATEIFAGLARTKSFGPPKLVEVQVQFTSNSHNMTGQAQLQCKEIAKAIKKVLDTPGLEKSQIRIEGHTDSQGRAFYNKALSLKRANAVKKELLSLNIPADRLWTAGWGEEKPIATNRTGEGRSTNRRVTLIRLDK
jgi:outer membrane protein OmpA-like peptidoglycan-associated protein